jgi:hypothetical protein
MLCCKSLDVSTRAMAKLALGSQSSTPSSTSRPSSSSTRKAKEGLGRYSELMASHPWPAEARARHARLRRERSVEATSATRARGSTMERGRREGPRHHQGRRLRALPMLETFHEKTREVVLSTRGARHAVRRRRREEPGRAGRERPRSQAPGRPLPPRRGGRVQPRQDDLRERAARSACAPVGVTPTTAGHPPPRVRGDAPRRRVFRFGRANPWSSRDAQLRGEQRGEPRRGGSLEVLPLRAAEGASCWWTPQA